MRLHKRFFFQFQWVFPNHSRRRRSSSSSTNTLLRRRICRRTNAIFIFRMRIVRNVHVFACVCVRFSRIRWAASMPFVCAVDIGFFALPLPYTVPFGTRAITPIQYEHSESEENETQYKIACIKRPKCFYQRRQQQQHQPKSTTNRSIIIECRRARSLSRIRFGVRLVQIRSPSQ